MMRQFRIVLKSYDHRLLDDFARQLVEAARRKGARVHGPIPLPTKKRIFTVLRSPFVNKDSREQFILRTHKRLIDTKEASEECIKAITELQCPAGVDISVKSAKLR